MVLDFMNKNIFICQKKQVPFKDKIFFFIMKKEIKQKRKTTKNVFFFIIMKNLIKLYPLKL
jgi:hypothetical protein